MQRAEMTMLEMQLGASHDCQHCKTCNVHLTV